MERTVAATPLEARVDVAAFDEENLDGGRDDLIERFRKREQQMMTNVEAKLLKEVSRKGIFELFFLYHPLFFYENKEACGEEVHAGHVSKWTTFIIVVSISVPCRSNAIFSPSNSPFDYIVMGI
jgi:predicted thioredoxin/glutaredoxin